MNEMKTEDVMEEAECCGYATGCTDCVLAKYDGSPCIVKKALALLREKDALLEEWDAKCKDYETELLGKCMDIEKLRAYCDEKDAEIERLTKERDLANAEREANVKGFTEDMSRMSVELDAMRAAANSLKMHLENAKAEAITEFVKLFDKEVSNNFVHYGWYIKQVILPKILKKMQEDNQ